jgi:hypothetical protein
MPNILIDINSLDIEDRIKEQMYDDINEYDYLDKVDLDLSNFELNIEYKIDVTIEKITLEKKEY